MRLRSLARPTRFMVILGSLLLWSTAELAAQVPLDALESMKARSIGPSGQGGRVTAIDALDRNPDVVFVGAASGGVWRSENAGTTWEPIFDDQPVQAIGAIAIDPSNPDVVWVGTGEGNPRNSSNQGNGIYRSLDGGDSWTHMGLEGTRVIHRVIVHPRDSDVVYLAVTGTPFGDSEERGVYRTTDGGASWERVLYVDERTGAADLVMDPVSPLKLMAAMWSHRREPDFMTSGGPGSGLWVTHDGGDSWTERTAEDGLPPGELGRIGVAIAPSDPDRVYAMVEAEKNVLLRSEDGGRSFRVVNDDEGVSPRPFYYSELHVDTANENKLYRLASLVHVSIDGGESFETLIGGAMVHVDHHAWWQDPNDPSLIYNGNDGGAAVSRDGGRSWQVYHNIPIGQFYHVNVDMELPYNVYGGLQDNDSFRGPAYHWVRQGIQNYVWENLSCCADGFDMAPDPTDGRYGYSMYQGGTLLRYDRVTGHLRLVSPTLPESAPLRYNWNAALALDPLVPGRVYFGSQFVHQSDDQGMSWRTISPDLTTNDPDRQRQRETGGLTIDDSGAENNTTITALGPSPVEGGVIWAGTDDGLVHVTTDGGGSWTEVTERMPDFPEGAWVPQVRPGYRSGGEAWVVVEDHRRDDWTPYVYVTDDYGRSWERVAEEIDGYALAVEPDPVEPDLVFVGTDRGLWFSVDSGDSWQRWTHGVPATPVRDMVVHPREHDLVMGTFGRSFLVLDDIRPLRRIAAEGAEVLQRPLAAYPVPDAYQAVMAWGPGAVFPGDFTYMGENRPTGARIRYSIAWSEDDTGQAEPEGDDDGGSDDRVTIEILDGATVVRRLDGPADPGLNMVTWGLERAGVRGPGRPAPDDPQEADEPGGPPILPGDYAVRISFGADTLTTPVTVHPDPRIAYDRSRALAVRDLWDEVLALSRRATAAADRVREALEGLDRVETLLGAGDYADADSLRAHGDQMREELDGFMERIRGTEDLQGFRSEPETVQARLGQVSQHLSGGLWAAPGEGVRNTYAHAEAAVNDLEATVEAFFGPEGPWSGFRTAVDAFGLELFPG